MATIRLYYDVPFDSRYEHSIYWGEKQRQLDYFAGGGEGSVTRAPFFQELTNFTYLRKEQAVKVPFSVEELEDRRINYCAILNNNKWRYYFVRNKEYVANTTTRLDVELDVLQTYQFDWQIPACFVEREHVTDDVAGNHLVDEGLELGELVVSNNSAQLLQDIIDLAIVVQTSVHFMPAGEAGPPLPMRGGIMGGVYSGLGLYAIPATNAGVQKLEAQLSILDGMGKTEAIQSIWMYPKALIDADWGDELTIVKGVKMIEWKGSKITSLDGYTPRNKKLLTYPYCFTYVYNNMGQGAKYRNELFSDAAPVLRVGGTVGNDGIVRLIPQNYRGYANDNESGLSISGYPTCAWNQDMYKIWMAQNANSQAVALDRAEFNMGTAAVSGIAGVIGSLATGNVGGAFSAAGNGITGVASAHFQQKEILARQSDKAVAPPQSRGVQSSSFNVAAGLQTFTRCFMTLQADYARRLDSYFDMYGYQVNTVKTPDLLSRPMWNYIKTVGCIVQGGIDAADRRLIATIFDKGVTLWHAPEIMYRYDLAANNK